MQQILYAENLVVAKNPSVMRGIAKVICVRLVGRKVKHANVTVCNLRHGFQAEIEACRLEKLDDYPIVPWPQPPARPSS